MKNPIAFFREVRQEVAKVTPPTRREVLVTSIMVFILALIAALFFFGADQLIRLGVELLLGVGG